jgi:hypothetical protein
MLDGLGFEGGNEPHNEEPGDDRSYQVDYMQSQRNLVCRTWERWDQISANHMGYYQSFGRDSNVPTNWRA